MSSKAQRRIVSKRLNKKTNSLKPLIDHQPKEFRKRLERKLRLQEDMKELENT